MTDKEVLQRAAELLKKEAEDTRRHFSNPKNEWCSDTPKYVFRYYDDMVTAAEHLRSLAMREVEK